MERSVGRIILSIGVLFALAIVGTRGLFLFLEYRQAITHSEERTREIAVILEENAMKQFGMAKLLSDATIRLIQRTGGVAAMKDSFAAHGELVALAQEFPPAARISVFDATGKLVATSFSFPAPDVSVTDREWWHAVNQGGQDQYIGELVTGRITNETILPYGRRLTGRNGAFEGAVAISLNPERLQDMYASTGFAQDLLLAMYRSDGHLLARNPLPTENVGNRAAKSNVYQAMGGFRVGTLRERSPIDGEERILSFRRLDRLPVVVVAGIKMDDTLRAWRNQLLWSVFIVGLALAGLASLTTIGLKLHRRETAAQAGLVESNARLTTALSEKETLFREIYHRTKNNIMMVISLLELQAMRFTDRAVRDAFTNTEERLRAMSMVYEALYRRESGQSLNIRDYLEALVGSLAEAYGASQRGIAFTTDIAELDLGADKAVPLALAINEAVTNAFKHAFPAGQGGEISIQLRCGGGICTLVVSDNGVGFDPGEERDSLGMKIIQSMTRQLSAQFRVERRPDGTGTVLVVDLPQ